MVCEFPELQGIIGAHYAKIQGENPEVCDAIRDQYRSAQEIANLTGALFSLADKIELITALFALGKEPTGSKDPFALRRAAIGILKIIEKFQLNLDLKEVIRKTLQELPNLDLKTNTTEKIYDFILERLKIVLKESGIRQNILNATVNTEDYILNIFFKSQILNNFLQDGPGGNLLSMHRRLKNIILSNDGVCVDEKLLGEKAEIILWDKIKKLEIKFSEIEKENGNFVEKFTKQLVACGEIELALAGFFDRILVNTDDERIKCNRLNLLTKLSFIFDRIIPYSNVMAS
jgi:glycyl-tRNA synthetase beta chain